MKKILLGLSVVCLLAASCNSAEQPFAKPSPTITPSPTSTVPNTATSTPNTYITKQQAINIVIKSSKADINKENIQATFKNNNWYVDITPKQPECNGCTVPPPHINGGDSHYIVDGKTGAITSRLLGQ